MQSEIVHSTNNSFLSRRIVDNKFTKPIVRYFKENLGILIGLLAMCTILSILSPAFLTKNNILNVLRQVSTNANLAIGMTLAIIICGIDLSVGSVLALSGTLAAGLITVSGLPVYVAVGIGLIVGTFCGF